MTRTAQTASPGAADNRPRTLVAVLRRVWPLIYGLARPRLGRLLVVLAFVVISRAISIVLPASTKYLVDDVLIADDRRLLGPLILAVASAVVMQAGAQLAATLIMAAEGLRFVAQLRARLQDHVTHLPLEFFDRSRAGALTSRIMDDPSGLRYLFDVNLVQFVGALMTAIYSVVFLVNISPRLAALSVAGLATFALLSKWGAYKRIHPLFEGVFSTASEVTGQLTESLTGIRVVKGCHGEGQQARLFAAGVDRLRARWVRAVAATSVVSSVSGVAMGLVTAAVMYLAALEILSGRLSIGGLVSFLAFLSFLVGPIVQLTQVGNGLAEALAGLCRVQELFDLRREDCAPARVTAMSRLRGEVAFEHVSFAYESARCVLHNISFATPAGGRVALVGPSGSGKSTMLNLVAGFYSPSTGTVRVDGYDLATVRLASYRPQVGIVLQEIFLFDGTLRENVVFARPDARDGDIRRACRIARVEEFAEELPEGYATRLGERGIKLSMGQRQRVAIARAILADPRILMLDEATSNLDSAAELAVQEGLNYLMTTRTTLIAAHRLATIRDADLVLVLDGGRIVEQGAPAALHAVRGRFHELAARHLDPLPPDRRRIATEY